MFSDEVLRVSQFTKEEAAELLMHFSAPIVVKYCKALAHVTLRDMLRLNFERAEDQLKLAARYAYGKGALEVLDNMVEMSLQEKQ